MSARSVAVTIGELYQITQGWLTEPPSNGELLTVEARVDLLAHSLARLGLVDAEPATARSAGAIAAEIANASRALHTISIGFRSHLPDAPALHAVQRLAIQLQRSVAVLRAALKDHEK